MIRGFIGTDGFTGELAQAEQPLHAQQEPGAPDAADQNGDLHSDRPYAVGRGQVQVSPSGVTATSLEGHAQVPTRRICQRKWYGNWFIGLTTALRQCLITSVSFKVSGPVTVSQAVIRSHVRI